MSQPSLAFPHDNRCSPGETTQGLNEVFIERVRSGTSIGLGGDFALTFDGSRTQYLKSNASARDVKLALEALDTIGTVDVERYDGNKEVKSSQFVQ